MKLQVGFIVLFACVLIAVAEDAPAKSEKVCEAGKEFTKDCNLCKCNEDGTQFACDTKSCPETQKVSQPTPETEKKCVPGELFKNKCNQCKCPESGLVSEAACTVIACPDE